MVLGARCPGRGGVGGFTSGGAKRPDHVRPDQIRSDQTEPIRFGPPDCAIHPRRTLAPTRRVCAGVCTAQFGCARWCLISTWQGVKIQRAAGASAPRPASARTQLPKWRCGGGGARVLCEQGLEREENRAAPHTHRRLSAGARHSGVHAAPAPQSEPKRAACRMHSCIAQVDIVICVYGV